jgi:predicted metalloprotease with PDZ domain
MSLLSRLGLTFLLGALVFPGSPLRAQSGTLFVDATDATRNLLHARETIAVSPGPLTLFYPKWIPGEHGPSGPVVDLAGLQISARGAALPWRRDLEEMFALHLEVPAGVSRLDLAFDFILPPDPQGFSSGSSSSAQLAVVSWNQVVLYPLGVPPDDFQVAPSLRLPAGWQYATALRPVGQDGATIRFAPVSLTRLIDSPVQAGAHFRRIALTADHPPQVFLNLSADSEAALGVSAETIMAYRRLVTEATALFGATHYDHYDFLFTLSDNVAHFGLEHHESSDDRNDERTLIDDDLRRNDADLLPHEYVHSWNGKFRRPAGLATGNYSRPMHDDLLWVYEGLTEYYGEVLTARSGLRTSEEFLEELAGIAASLDHRPGRTWRPLQDTADEASLLYYTRSDYDSLRRSVDFYDEGVLLWLEADVTIRRLSQGARSLDDFCRGFYGPPSGSPRVVPYTADDVAAALNAVVPYDWKGFFQRHLQSLAPRAPLGGIEAGGWKLVYKDTATAITRSREAANKNTNAYFSLGFTIGEDGSLADVVPGSPGARAGLSPGMKLIAVNGRKYSADLLHAALKEGAGGSAPLALLAENRDIFATYSVDYHGGEQYPWLERVPGGPDFLSAIAAPRTDGK